MDLYARKIVGWALASHMRASLVCSALNMAIIARQPSAGLVVHTDYGCRLHSSLGYLSLNQFEAKLTENQPIMSIEVSNFS